RLVQNEHGRPGAARQHKRQKQDEENREQPEDGQSLHAAWFAEEKRNRRIQVFQCPCNFHRAPFDHPSNLRDAREKTEGRARLFCHRLSPVRIMLRCLTLAFECIIPGSRKPKSCCHSFKLSSLRPATYCHPERSASEVDGPLIFRERSDVPLLVTLPVTSHLFMV